MHQNTVRYVHTNIIAKDWRRLAQFYIDVFGCRPLYPERNLAGEWIEQLTTIPGVYVRGIHLQLPGWEDGPTLEIFEYEPENLHRVEPQINHQGLGHLAFHTDSVVELLEKFIAHGGTKLSEIVEKDYEGLGLLTVVYAQDPEGNFVEIQNWGK